MLSGEWSHLHNLLSDSSASSTRNKGLSLNIGHSSRQAPEPPLKILGVGVAAVKELRVSQMCVWFTSESGHSQRRRRCLQSANSGLSEAGSTGGRRASQCPC